MKSIARRTFSVLGASLLVLGAQAKPEVRQRDQLPKREYLLPATASEMVSGPLARWLPLAAELERDIRADLNDHDIVEPALLRERYLWLAQLAQLHGDAGQVRAWQQRARRLQDDPVAKHLSGVINELVAEALANPKQGDATLRDRVRERFMAMPWGVVGPSVKTFRDQLAAATAESLLETIRKKVDQQVAFSGSRVTMALAMQVLGAALQYTQVSPRLAMIVGGLDDVLRARA